MISEDQKYYYAGLWALKMLDLSPEDGGLDFSVAAAGEWASLEPVLERLAVDGLVSIDRKKGLYLLTDAGLDRLANAIDEAEALIDEFDEQETPEMLTELRRRRLDPLRVRYLWGWYQGEFDDLVVFQQRRGADVVEADGGAYLLGDALYEELAGDLTPE